MDRLKIYKKVRKHLLAQGTPSLSEDGCAYRGDGGLRCAIGCLIWDRYYTEDLEGFTPESLDVRIALCRCGYKYEPYSDDEEFLVELQSIHDGLNPETWEEQLDDFATEWFDLFFK